MHGKPFCFASALVLKHLDKPSPSLRSGGLAKVYQRFGSLHRLVILICLRIK